MMRTITDGTTTLELDLVTGYSSARSTPNVLHRVIGRTDPEVTLGALHLRTGTLTIWCAGAAEAQAVVDLHAAAVVLTLTDTDIPQLDMSYVVAEGDVTMDPDPATMVRWIVSVPFGEVVP